MAGYGNNKPLKLISLNQFKKLWEKYKEDTPTGTLSQNIFIARYLNITKATFIAYKKRTDINNNYHVFFEQMNSDMEERNLTTIHEPFKANVGMFLLKVQNKYIESDKEREIRLNEAKFEHQKEVDWEKLKQEKELNENQTVLIMNKEDMKKL